MARYSDDPAYMAAMKRDFNDPAYIREWMRKSKQEFICLECLDTGGKKIRLEDVIRMPKRTWLYPECKNCPYNNRNRCTKAFEGDRLSGRDPDYIPVSHLCEVGRRTEDGEMMSMTELCCPLCKNPIHRTIGKNIIISIVGSRDTGKSHYIGVLLHELVNQLAEKMHWSVVPDPNTAKIYNANFASLYSTQQTLNLTPKNMTGFYDPYIYYVTPEKGKTFTITFFDTAGEDFESDDLLESSAKHVFQAQGIIFLMDPLKIAALEKTVEADVSQASASVHSNRAMNNAVLLTLLSNCLHHHLDIPENKKIKIPIALTFSKFDTICKQLPSYNTVLFDSKHKRKGRAVLSDFKAVDVELRRFLNKIGNVQIDSFLTQVDVNYEKSIFFAASALGLRNHPVNGRFSTPRPHRVEDPLLWILKENGVIDFEK